MSGPPPVATLSSFQPVGCGSREVRLGLTHSHLPPPFGWGHRLGLHRMTLAATMPAADFSPAIGSDSSSPSRPFRRTRLLGEHRGDLPGYFRLLSTHDRQIYGFGPSNGWKTSSCVADSSRPAPPHLPAPATSCRLDIPVRRPASLPPASFRRTSLHHPCLRLTFASV